MTSKRKGQRCNQKRLDYKREDSTALRMKVLRSALALGVGFAMSPWLGREVHAADPAEISNGIIERSGQTTNLLKGNTAHIYAEKSANGVGLNSFERFILGNGQIANLYFQKEGSSENLHSLVNTVNGRIYIYGTVNAIRNSKVGGNLYFLSSDGMVVGSSGAINAGSLTAITSGRTFGSAGDAASAIQNNDFGSLDSNASIDIHGRINTATGIDLRAAYINVKKAEGASTAPLLQTGAMFDTTVNTAGLVTSVNLKSEHLTASVDASGNVVIADPSNEAGATGAAALTGDGSMQLAASSTTRNTDTEFWA